MYIRHVILDKGNVARNDNPQSRFPSKVTMSVTSPQAEIVAAAQDLVKVLLMPSTFFLDLHIRLQYSHITRPTCDYFQNSVLEHPAIPPNDVVEDGEDSSPLPRVEMIRGWGR